jgi:micrococcal nuclease
VDGDTVELADGRRVRYLGINTPERGQHLFEEATSANQRLTEGQIAWIVLDTQPTDQYGRILAYVWVGDLFVNQELVGLGYANAYTKPPNVRFSEEILAAEQEARKAGLGLWAMADIPVTISEIHYDAPGPDHENPNGEWIVFENEGSDAIDLSGFSLKDAANHIYTFPSTSLEPGAELKLHSGQGPDTNGTLFWGLSGDAVWSNSGDSAYLRDPQGRLVDHYTY